MPLNAEQQLEIQRSREKQAPTRRTTVAELEDVLYKAIPVLDQGFIRVIDYMGDDAAIVQAARVSYGSGTKKISDDKGLIRYLMRHHHSTPFEMCEIKLHVKLPIFVARQWVRHRTANINEYSARYSVLDKEFYIPDEEYLKTIKAERKVEQKRRETGQSDMFGVSAVGAVKELGAQSKENKQGRDEALSKEEAEEIIQILKSESTRAYTIYTKLLNEHGEEQRKGVARELARVILPTSVYTQWYWKTDLHNLLHFLQLRGDSHAQYEIRVYAQQIADLVKRWVPLTFAAFEDYRANAVSISSTGLTVLKRLLAGEKVVQANSGLTPREWRELNATLGRSDG